MRRTLTIALLCFVAVTILYAFGVFRREGPTSTSAESAEPRDAASSPTVIAYYFHTSNRCANCMKFEAWGSEAFQGRLGERLKTGEVEWKVLNIEEPQNRHFIDEYRLHTKAIILSRLQDGKQVQWKNLERIWDLLKDKDAFTQYVASETERFLTQGSQD